MISKEELREIGKRRNYNLGQAEKDYFQDIILFILYQEFGKELVFKGGTALSKCYGLDRFSQDLDFTLHSKKDLKPILTSGLERFFIPFELKEKEYEDGKKIILRIEGPLYTGNRGSLCRIELDISLRERVFIDPKRKRIGRFLPEIPSFTVIVMSNEEILAEKVRSILTRDMARDIYDINFLLDLDTEINPILIEKKLQYYEMKFDPNSFYKALKRKRDIWSKELKPIVKEVPPFSEVLGKIKMRFEEVYGGTINKIR